MEKQDVFSPFKILDLLPFKMKPLEGRKSRKNTGKVLESTEEVLTFETIVNDNEVKNDVLNPSYTFRVQISKS